MAQDIIRHRRLYAFYNSRVLNILMVVIIASLMLADATHLSIYPLLCSAISFLFFVGYSLWLWIKKPHRIVIDTRLSDLSGLLVFYFIAISLVCDGSTWLNLCGFVAALLILTFSFVWSGARLFDI